MSKAECKVDKKKSGGGVIPGLGDGDLEEGCFRLTALSRGPMLALRDGCADRDPTRTTLMPKGVR